MKVTLWGTRGSLATPGPESVRHGGNTACVEVRGADGTVLVLDAGTGIRRLGAAIDQRPRRVDVLLSHLHMDHIQGLGFFKPLVQRDREVHIWGPSSTTLDLRARLSRYLSPPLFPVHLRDLPCELQIHDVVAESEFRIGGFEVKADLVCHPGPTVGYRIAENGVSVAYIPDHEPALGAKKFPRDREWISGFDLAAGVDLLIHDAQYTAEEYRRCVGWGHCTISDAIEFAAATGAKRLVLFHHDPSHSDDILDRLFDEATKSSPTTFDVLPGTEGSTFDVE